MFFPEELASYQNEYGADEAYYSSDGARERYPRDQDADDE